MAMLPQNLQTLFWKKTLREDLLDQTARMDLPPAEGAAAVAEIAALCGLEGLLDRHPYDLSGGEQQRAALAKVLLTRPEVLLLDEPLNNLDMSHARALMQRPEMLLADEPTGSLDEHNAEQVMALMMAAVRDTGAGLLLVSHNPGYGALADRVLRLEGGQLVELKGRRHG